MFVAKNQHGLYLRGAKRGKLIFTTRALDALEFASNGELEYYLQAFAPQAREALELVA